MKYESRRKRLNRQLTELKEKTVTTETIKTTVIDETGEEICVQTRPDLYSGTIWETFISGGPFCGYIRDDYDDFESAKLGHEKWCDYVRSRLKELESLPVDIYLADNPSAPSCPTKWHIRGCPTLAGIESRCSKNEAEKVLAMQGVELSWASLCKRCSKRRKVQ